VTASMLRRTEPVVSLVPRFKRRVQSKRAAASTLWMRRFVRKSADAAIVSLRSASRVIAATRIAPPRVGRRPAAHRSGPGGNASDIERFFIETLYDRDFTGNLEREQRTLELWAESYPRDARPHGLISGVALTGTGQYELSIAEADKAIALDPDLTPAYTTGPSISPT
jgi:hypothetical protein